MTESLLHTHFYLLLRENRSGGPRLSQGAIAQTVGGTQSPESAGVSFGLLRVR